jgi:type IV pilus assembly protein PilN
MAHINLLPWREILRQQQKQRYLGVLLAIALLMIGLAWLANLVYTQLITQQNIRNRFLEQQIVVLDSQISQIKTIRAEKAAIEQRMTLIEQLQTIRNVAALMLNELVNILPDGITFEHLSRFDNTIEIQGISQSNNRLATFMRRLEESEVFINSELSSIVANTGTSDAVSHFKLTFALSPAVAPQIRTEPENKSQ